MILACFWVDIFHTNTIFLDMVVPLFFFYTIGIPYDYYTMVPKYSSSFNTYIKVSLSYHVFFF